MKFKDINIRLQLLFGFGIVLIFVVVLGTVSFIQSDKVQKQLVTIYNHPVTVRHATFEIRTNINEINSAIKNISTTNDKKIISLYLDQIDSSKIIISDQIKILTSQYLGPVENIDSLEKSFVKWNFKCDSIIPLIEANNYFSSKSNMTNFDIVEEYMNHFLDQINTINTFAINKNDELYNTSLKVHKSLIIQLILLTSIVLLLSIIIYYILLRNIKIPLDELIHVTRKFHFGDLDIRSTYKNKNEFGELSDSFNEMAEKIKKELEFDKNIIIAKNKELENYLYTASHDLRSPLVNIQGFSQRLQTQINTIKCTLEDVELVPESRIVLDKIINENIPKSLNYISTNVIKMDILLNGLLQLSRTGLMKMNIKKINTNELIKKILNSFNFEITKYSADVLLNDLTGCYGDENQLNQLFSNIIGNAIKYRDKDRQLIIEIYSYVQDDKVIYVVKDNGIGIESKHLDKIWDVFYRVDPTSSELGEGIGLNITKTIVNKHGGKIWVESEKDKGSMFYVELLKNKFSE